jgi:hypothetical protein
MCTKSPTSDLRGVDAHEQSEDLRERAGQLVAAVEPVNHFDKR